MSLVPRQAGDLSAIGAAEQVTDAWLANRRLSPHTRDAYRRDVSGWLGWCRDRDVDPLRASFLDVNAYARGLEDRNLAAATVARKLSGVSSWYDFLVKLRAVEANPVGGADRPAVSRDFSSTVGLTPPEVDALLAAVAAETGPAAVRNRAVITLLADLGLRVGEVVGLDVTDVSAERGHRTIRFTGKGGKPRRRALTDSAAAAVDDYLTGCTRTEGPLFVTAYGARIDRHAVFRLVRRLAQQAGIEAWDRLSPHSLRHAFATTARAEGVPLEDVQDAMGHADPRTTRRYDRDRHNLDRDPAYTIAAARARRAGSSPAPILARATNWTLRCDHGTGCGLNIVQAVLLGAVEGITEFLPVSSTGHLTIVESLFGFDIDAKDITAFTAIIQSGAVLAAIIFLRKDLIRIVAAWFRGLMSAEARENPDWRLAWAVILGSIPIGVVGLLFQDVIEGALRSLWWIAGALIVWSGAMAFADHAATQIRHEDDVTWKDTLVIGVVQCLALIPGVSRSGATMSAGLLRDIDRVTVTKLSFFLSIPALLGATVLQVYTQSGDISSGVGWTNTLIATVVSFLVGYAAVAWLLRFIAGHTFSIFIGYRLVLGALLLVLLATGAIDAQ